MLLCETTRRRLSIPCAFVPSLSSANHPFPDNKKDSHTPCVERMEVQKRQHAKARLEVCCQQVIDPAHSGHGERGSSLQVDLDGRIRGGVEENVCAKLGGVVLLRVVAVLHAPE